MFNTHRLMDFFNIKQSLRNFFSTFCTCNPISTGTLAAGGSEGQLGLPVGSHRAQEESTSLGVGVTHTRRNTHLLASHTTHTAQMQTSTQHQPQALEVCSTLGKPNM